MIERAYIHVGGPQGCGKTTFVEAVLGGTDEAILAARGVRNDALRRARETAPKAHPELSVGTGRQEPAALPFSLFQRVTLARRPSS